MDRDRDGVRSPSPVLLHSLHSKDFTNTTIPGNYMVATPPKHVPALYDSSSYSPGGGGVVFNLFTFNSNNKNKDLLW